MRPSWETCGGGYRDTCSQSARNLTSRQSAFQECNTSQIIFSLSLSGQMPRMLPIFWWDFFAGWTHLVQVCVSCAECVQQRCFWPTVFNILAPLHPTSRMRWKMNGGNKQRKLGSHLQIPPAYLLIGLHLLKNFAQLASFQMFSAQNGKKKTKAITLGAADKYAFNWSEILQAIISTCEYLSLHFLMS